MLIPSRTDTRWFHEWVYGKAELRFVKGRLRFNDSKHSAPFPSLVVVYRGATHDEKLPPAQLGTNLAEVGTDCISRQAAIDTIESWLSCDDYNEAERHIMRAMQNVLYDLPSVNPQKPKSECEHDHEILKAYSDGASAVLDKIRAEIEHVKDNPLFGMVSNDTLLEVIVEIIDKYKGV